MDRQLRHAHTKGQDRRDNQPRERGDERPHPADDHLEQIPDQLADEPTGIVAVEHEGREGDVDHRREREDPEHCAADLLVAQRQVAPEQ